MDQQVSLLAVGLSGSLLNSMQSLLEASKGKEDKNLPIVRLRAALMAKLEGVVRLDRDLGLRDPSKPALEMRWASGQDRDGVSHEDIKQDIADILMRWHRDVVAPWAERNGIGTAASEVRSHISAGNIDLQAHSQPLIARQPSGRVAKPQWDLIAKHLAERLVGEELFPGLGPCELIADATSLEGAVELTTWPAKAPGSDTVFSMVARLSVASWPTGRDLHVKVTPVKRVWAKKPPGRKPNAPLNIRCYIFSAENPVLPATMRRGKSGWEFGDDYIQYLAESGGALPRTPELATESPRPSEPGWWVGLPELTTLYDYIQQRTVFEADEVDLRDRLVELMPDVLDPDLPFRLLKTSRAMTQAKSEVARLQIDDVLPSIASEQGWAGAALEVEVIADEVDNDSDEEQKAHELDSANKRRERLERHRLANEQALARIHGQQTPSLWVFVDGTQEQQLIEQSARTIFGDRVRLEFSTLPLQVHGLRTNLELDGEKGIRRFEARVERWKSVAEQVRQGASGARHVLICAPKDVGNRPEDPVNYFAGLHAMCHYAKANVHHLLPLETDRRTARPDFQHFIHRVQSALLDVFLAHSGVVFGTDSFVGGCLGDAAPRAIYGVQAIRSQARAFTQEQPVSLIVFTRLDVASGVTSVSFACRSRTRVLTTELQPLNEGLQWLGSQRQLTSDETWLRENFSDITRKELNKISEADPRAVVLIDWSTVAGLWKEISDESLISRTGRGAWLDDLDLEKAFPQMTLLRLRSDRNATLVMRWVNTTTFEEWRTDPQPEPTRQTTEEQYATTYKTIVELEPDAEGRHAPHYLVVMGYRSTVQTKRGMSCYRPRPRMGRNKSGWFERRLLPVAKDNAALPSGLEITVLHAPQALNPDSLVKLVMGLRLGYAHYDDWTALPAPLFFVRKVRDYIIRYPEAPDSPLGEEPTGLKDGPADDGGVGGVEASTASDLQLELAAQVLQQLPELGVGAASQPSESVAQNVVMEPAASSEGREADAAGLEGSSATPSMDGETPPSEPLKNPHLQRALEAGLATPELFKRSSGRPAKQLYEAMLLGTVRVRVELPWFVNKDTVLPPDGWPKDRRAIGRYWRELGQFPIRLRHQRGEAPTVSQFPDWVMRRLSIPQSHYWVDIPDLFPSEKRLFHRIDDAYTRFLEDAGRSDEKAAPGQFWRDMADFATYLCSKSEDETLGWVFCLLGHQPYKDVLPKVFRAVDSSSLGPYAQAGLEYMTHCFEVCRDAYNDRVNGSHEGKAYVVSAAAKPANLTSSVLERRDSGPVSRQPAASMEAPVLAHSQADAPPAEVAAESSAAEAPLTELAQSSSAGAETPAVVDASLPPGGVLSWPVPGSDTFDTDHGACLEHLSKLVQAHEQLKAAREAQRLAERLRLEALAAEAVAQAAAKERWDRELSALAADAQAAISGLSDDADIGSWRVVDLRTIFGETPDATLLAEVVNQVRAVRAAAEESAEAASAVERIEAGDFEGAAETNAKKRNLKRMLALQEAMPRVAEADDRLKQALQRCQVLAPLSDTNADATGTSDESTSAEAQAQTVSDVVVVASAQPVKADGESAEAPQAGEAVAMPEPSARPAATPEASAQAEGLQDGVAVKDETQTALATLHSQPEPLPASHSDDAPANVAVNVDLEESEQSDTGDEESESLGVIGPLTLIEPAQRTLQACLESKHLALACVAAMALGEVDSRVTARLWSLGTGILRSGEMRASFDPTALKALQTWLEHAPERHSTGGSFAEHLGVLGTSLLPMLLQGDASGIRWSAIEYLRPRLQPHSELLKVVERIASLDTIQLNLTPEILSAAQVSMRQALEERVARMRKRAANWSSDSELVTNWTATDYVELHAAICTDKHGFATGSCIAAIARGDDGRARKLLPEVHKLADKGLATISDMRKRVGRRRPVEGVGRDYLVDNLKTTSRFAHEFFELLDRLKAGKHEALPAKHVEFLSGLYRELLAARDYVNALGLPEGEASIHRRLLLCALDSALGLMEQRSSMSSLSEEDQLLVLQYPLAHDMRPALTWSPPNDPETSVPLADVSQLLAAVERVEHDSRADGAAPLQGAELQALLVDAATGHRRAERLLPARLIEERLGRISQTAATSVAAANDAARREARTKLTADLQEARQRVTNALALSALPQAEASRMLKVVESLLRANGGQEIAAPQKPTALYADFPHARAVLQAVVLTPLDTKIQESRARLRLEIEEFVTSQRDRNLDPAVLRQLEQKAQRILARLDIGTALSVRVARNEFLLLREDKLPLLKFDEQRAGPAFEAFLIEARRATQGHRLLDGLHGLLSGSLPLASSAPEWLTALTELERREAADLVSRWMAVFSSGTKAGFAEALTDFLRTAGLSQDPTVLSPNEGKFFLDGKPFAGLAASGFGVFIPPALGSDATHIQGVVVASPVTFERLGQRVAQLPPTTPTFLLTRFSLKSEQRAQLGRDHPVLLVDDDLVAYVALHPGARLSTLLEVCLLSFKTNPYADYGARPVPPEMFFGRIDELGKLRNVPSAAVLYGGRRLGKSSLLNQILEESKVHLNLSPGEKGRGEMAIYVPLDSGKDPAGFGQDYRLFAWKAIHKALVSAGFLDAGDAELQSDQAIRDRIQDEIVAGRARTNACYLLIDEADDVMREDLQANAPFLASLQNLSDSVLGHCRLRYVIAGLHNLTRMTTGGNTALGKATSIALQPFSSEADILKGVDLITKPLAALGFHFGKGDEGLPMRILAVCNFYPAFIQLYCRNLVNRLYNKRAGKEISTLVTSEDLDAVERDQEFLREIQEKFGLNLNLDKRYKAIALILAEYSYAEPAGSVFAGLTATEIRDHCAVYAPEHFKTTAPGAYEALLDEMEKLTILERNGSRYQLRTPDIATMLGDKEQVSHHLNELARETPTEARSKGEARLSVTQRSDSKTFPMPSAWLRNYMRGNPTDLVIFVGNQVSGISVFEKLRDPWEISNDDATIEAKTFGVPEEARTFLNSARKKAGPARNRLVAVLARGWQIDQIETYSALAQSFGRAAGQSDGAGRPKLPTVRPVLIASPEQALVLAMRQSTQDRPLPKNTLIAAIPPWSDDAVHFRFNDTKHENLAIRDSAPARQALLQASCGFGDEIERLSPSSLTVEEAVRLPQEARQRLTPDLASFYARVGLPGSIDAPTRKALEDLLILMHGESRAESKEQEHLSSLNLQLGHFVFAQWMGLIQPSNDGTWEVPSLYLELLERRPA
ncbi:DUF3893 domain-containing protein [Ideonella sp. 4Y16]|nr:DUF3893 domain-containing protein [Ideonella alba]